MFFPRIDRLVFEFKTRAFENIRHNIACRREFSRAGSGHHHFRHCVALYKHGVKHAPDARENLAVAYRGRRHAGVNFAVPVFASAYELHGIAGFFEVHDILGRNGGNALCFDFVRVNVAAEASRTENSRFAGGVKALDIVRGVFFGKAVRLSVRESGGKRGLLFSHFGEYEVRRAVENSEKSAYYI